jgi:hypothetical protein
MTVAIQAVQYAPTDLIRGPDAGAVIPGAAAAVETLIVDNATGVARVEQADIDYHRHRLRR